MGVAKLNSGWKRDMHHSITHISCQCFSLSNQMLPKIKNEILKSINTGLGKNGNIFLMKKQCFLSKTLANKKNEKDYDI